MTKRHTTVTDEQAKALEVVASGGDIGQAADAAGVNRVTLWRWRENPVFAQAWEEARIKASGELLSTAQDIVRAALARVHLIVTDDREWQAMDQKDRTDFLRFVLNTPYARRLAGDGAVVRTEHRETREIVWNRAPVALVDGDVTRTYEPPARALPDAADAEVESVDESPDEIPPDVA